MPTLDPRGFAHPDIDVAALLQAAISGANRKYASEQAAFGAVGQGLLSGADSLRQGLEAIAQREFAAKQADEQRRFQTDISENQLENKAFSENERRNFERELMRSERGEKRRSERLAAIPRVPVASLRPPPAAQGPDLMKGPVRVVQRDLAALTAGRMKPEEFASIYGALPETFDQSLSRKRVEAVDVREGRQDRRDTRRLELDETKARDIAEDRAERRKLGREKLDLARKDSEDRKARTDAVLEATTKAKDDRIRLDAARAGIALLSDYEQERGQLERTRSSAFPGDDISYLNERIASLDTQIARLRPLAARFVGAIEPERAANPDIDSEKAEQFKINELYDALVATVRQGANPEEVARQGEAAFIRVFGRSPTAFERQNSLSAAALAQAARR